MPVQPIRLEPTWKPLGYEVTPSTVRYWFLINGEARSLRAVDVYGYGFLADIYPDMEYWRRQFPWGNRRIDKARAASFFIKAARDAGAYSRDKTADIG